MIQLTDRSAAASANCLQKLWSTLTLALFLFIPVSAQTIQPISSGYGANGNYTMEEIKFPNPLFQTVEFSAFHPCEMSTPLPTIFFAPWFSGTNPQAYRPLIFLRSLTAIFHECIEV